VNGALETAVILLGLEGLAATGAVVYVVRRVSPWPKPPPVTVPAAAVIDPAATKGAA
jgi:hypothetical protein